jgi:hypothetical protein
VTTRSSAGCRAHPTAPWRRCRRHPRRHGSGASPCGVRCARAERPAPLGAQAVPRSAGRGCAPAARR